MNPLLKKAMEIFSNLSEYVADKNHCDLVVCPPYVFLKDMAELAKNSEIKVGAQNCYHEKNGAYTGEVSAEMIADLGCQSVILGHSERRTTISEGSELVKKKAQIANENGLSTIICVGETLYERENNLTKVVIREQVLHSMPKTANSSNTTIAYEPVWAIGTGSIPSLEQIEEVHVYIQDVIKAELEQFTKSPKIIYGGSINGKNSGNILSVKSVDGLLVGKASLNTEEFNKIIDSAK